ncbi:uncharacterized protein BT62DRAFT_926947, partial [Guyanagaster necrorhizus]
ITPIIELITNVKASSKSTEILGTTKYVIMTYRYHESMIFGVTYNPAFTMNVVPHGIGIPTEKKAGFSQERLGILNDVDFHRKVVLKVHGSDCLEYKGTTFNVILASMPSRD